jgi:hypothetical protein
MSEASSEAREILFEEAYQRLLPEYESLKGDELVAINLDIASTVSTVLGVSPRLASLTARIAQELPDFDLGLSAALHRWLTAAIRALAHATLHRGGLRRLGEGAETRDPAVESPSTGSL